MTIFSLGVGIGSVLCNKLLKGEINGRLVPYGCIGMTLAIVDFYFASSSFGQSYFTLPCSEASEACNRMNSRDISEFLSTFAGWRIAFDLLALAVCAGIYIVPLYAIMQHRSDERYLARIIAANNVMNACFMVVGSVVVVGLFALEVAVAEVLLTFGLLNIPVYFVVRGIVKRRLNDA